VNSDSSILQVLAGFLVISCPIVVLIWLVVIASRRAQRDRRVQNGECAFCGYDLRESPRTCPECGSIPEPADRARAALNALLTMPRATLQPKDFKEAVRVCSIILRDSVDAKDLNLAAWVLAATKNPPFHDPPAALELAPRACELTNFEQATCLDTLGVYYAACGQFDQAIHYVELAMQRCSGVEHAGCEKRLQLFRAGEVYCE
jgi:hypothetical protein